MTTIKLSGRLLFLSSSAEIMGRQLSGANVSSVDAGILRDDVSTDEITPCPS